MVRRDDYLPAIGPGVLPLARPPVLPLAALVMGLLVGCGTSLSPQQTQAMSKLQDLGARINFKRGGYEVNLTETPVEDKDLVHLQNIPNLKTLDLGSTQITDAGLEHLRSIDSLEFVVLTRTMATVKGIENLRKALPNTDVRY
jgi:hypothetical protein